MTAPSAATRRTILASLFVRGALDKATLTGSSRREVDLEVFEGDNLPSGETFDSARRWLVTHDLVRWEAVRGRRSNLMSLGSAWGYAVGVVLGPESVRAGIADARGAQLEENGEALLAVAPAGGLEGRKAQDTIERAADLVAQLVRRSQVKSELIRGVTVAVPFPVDLAGNVAAVRGTRDPAARAPRAAFERALKERDLGNLAIDIDNDANVAGIGEWHARWERADGPTTLVALKVSAGIGGALINSQGIVHRGAHGAAGELGHDPVDVSHLPVHELDLPALDPDAACRCGGHGHLEGYASARAIVDRVRPGGGDHDYGVRYRDVLGTLMDPAAEDHARVRQALYDGGWLLGRAVIPIMEFVDPDLVIITGRMRAAGATFTSAIIDGLRSQPRLIGSLPDVIASGYDWTGVLGAIRNTLQNRPPMFPEGLTWLLSDLANAMRLGPTSWQVAAPLLAPKPTRHPRAADVRA